MGYTSVDVWQAWWRGEQQQQRWQGSSSREPSASPPPTLVKLSPWVSRYSSLVMTCGGAAAARQNVKPEHSWTSGAH